MQAVDDTQAKKLISANLTRLLDERGWTQSQLAERSGESEMTISRTIRGKNQASAGTLKNLADAFGVATDDFFRNSRRNGK